MSEIRVDNITNEAGTGSPGFPNGLVTPSATVSGTLDVASNIQLDSNGISFDSGSNYLDDYEEGEFSPGFGGWNGIYSLQHGRYIKIGRLVHLSGAAITTADATKSFTKTFMRITDLPFSIQREAVQINGMWNLTGSTNTTASFFKFGFFDGTFPNNAVDGSGGSGRSNFETSNLSPGTSVSLRFTMTYIAST